MGCCVSTTTADWNDNNAGDSSASEKKRAPPPTIVEEETVKEVLSETTMLTSSNDNPAEKKTQNQVMAKIEEEDEKPEILKVHQSVAPAPGLTRPYAADPIDNAEDGSEVSDICSLSVSESVSTITMNESKREDAYEEEEEEVRQKQLQQMRQRSSPAKSRNRVVGNYPTRRTEQSPGKKNVGASLNGGSVRLVQSGRDSGTRIGSRSVPAMRDPVERSGRRSRSPARNRSVVGPTTTSGVRRKNNQSPGRATLDPDNSRSEQQSKWASCSAAASNYNGAANESLENPLVSLECFIFL